jgi:hypothetical protein
VPLSLLLLLRLLCLLRLLRRLLLRQTNPPVVSLPGRLAGWLADCHWQALVFAPIAALVFSFATTRKIGSFS